eukprot:3692871-Prymnesium_polylepis.1
MGRRATSRAVRMRVRFTFPVSYSPSVSRNVFTHSPTITCGSASCARPTVISARAVMLWGSSTPVTRRSSPTTATARPRGPASAPPT